MGFTGDKADQFKADFIQLFNSQEAQLLQWKKQRQIASDNTKLANDQVYQLRNELATVIPESKRCTMLMVHIPQAITKAVTGSANTKRTMMPADQLYQIGQLEQKVNAEIERLRLDGVAPLQIRDDVLAMIKTAGKKEAPSSDETKKDFL